MKLRMQAYILAASYWLVAAQVLTFRYVCDAGEALPDYYGFPAIKSSSVPWVFSLEGQIFPVGFAIDVAVWFVVLNGVLFAMWRTNIPRRVSGVAGATQLRFIARAMTSVVFAGWALSDWLLLRWFAQDELIWFDGYSSAWDLPCRPSTRSFHLAADGSSVFAFLMLIGIVLALSIGSSEEPPPEASE